MIAAGLRPEDAWRATPREVMAIQAGYRTRDVGRLQEALWAAYHVAAFSRAKRLPNLREALDAIGRPQPKQETEAKLRAQARALTVLMGGRVGGED